MWFEQIAIKNEQIPPVALCSVIFLKSNGSDLLLLLFTIKRLWANHSRRSLQKSKYEQFAQVVHHKRATAAICSFSWVEGSFAWRCEMCWLIGSATDFWGRGPRFESGISHNDPGALQDHCVILQNLRVEKGSFTWDQKKYKEKICLNSQPLKIMTYILK